MFDSTSSEKISSHSAPFLIAQRDSLAALTNRESRLEIAELLKWRLQFNN